MKHAFADLLGAKSSVDHVASGVPSREAEDCTIRRVNGSHVRAVAEIFLCGVWLAASLGCSANHRPADADPFNVVLISIDTLAADHLGLYGYSRNTSPNLDRYAESAIVFENAYSTAPKTPESHMSMFTSLYPSVHGVFTIDDPNELRVLGDEARTLPEILKANGYTTIGFHGGGYVDGQFGFARGFDEYHQGEQRRAEEWLWRNGEKGKFFLFFHTYRVHDPYTPMSPYDRRFDSDYAGPIVHDLESLMKLAESTEWVDYSKTFWSQVDRSDPDEVAHVVALYDGVIAEMDANLVGLLSTIDRHAPRTIVIILSDHGEEFGQHGGFTHSQLYDEVLRVPLIIRHPDQLGGERIAERVSLIDLAPTILEMLSIPAEAQFQGRALFDRSDRQANARSVFSEFPLQQRMALIQRDQKLMSTSGNEEFYDLSRDPAERRDLLLSESERSPDGSATDVDALRGEMARVARENTLARDRLGLRESTETPADEVLQQLKALGYLE